jgi:hypothetical protein
MFRSFQRLSVAAQTALLLILMLCGTLSALFFWARDNAVRSELAHSRTVADMADSFRAVAARHGGFYIRRAAADDVSKVGRFLATYHASQKTPDGATQEFVFHQKNPFLALGDFSAEVQRSRAAAKFRITSDNYMNPANAPDLFDTAALRTMRETDVSEYWDVVGGNFRYARALRAEKSCIACHGDPGKAPEVVRTQYRAPIGAAVGGGYGYEEGQVVGLSSVTIPHLQPAEMLAHQSRGFWISAAGVLGLMLLAFGSIVWGLVRPLGRLSRYAHVVATSDDLSKIRGPVFDADEANSRNEIHLQAHALKSLHESMQAAIDHINRGRVR